MLKKILIPIDLQHTPLARTALAFAIDQARQNQAGLTLMTVVPGYGMPIVGTFFPAEVRKQAKESVKAELKRYAAEHLPEDIPVKLHVTEGSTAEEILRTAKRLGVDLIVMPGSGGRRSSGTTTLGSSVARVVHDAECSVMVIKG